MPPPWPILLNADGSDLIPAASLSRTAGGLAGAGVLAAGAEHGLAHTARPHARASRRYTLDIEAHGEVFDAVVAAYKAVGRAGLVHFRHPADDPPLSIAGDPRSAPRWRFATPLDIDRAPGGASARLTVTLEEV